MLKKSLRVFALAAVLLAIPVVSSAWKFASIADSRGESAAEPIQIQTLTKIISWINSENADLVIFEGDSVRGSKDTDTLGSQLDTWMSVMAKLNCPYYISVGNHEIQSSGAENMVRSKFAMPADGPMGYKELAYSFDYLNARFICLDSDKWSQPHHVQRSWLVSALASTTQPHIFVFAHEPAFPKGPHIGSSLDVYPAERDDFWSILSKHGVRIYLCGHEHFYNRSEVNGVFQIINGTCGVLPAANYAGTIAKPHYVIVDVTGNDVSGVARDENGALLDSWSYSVAPDVASARAKPNGTKVSLMATVMKGPLDGYFYAEDTKRRRIRVKSNASVAVGDKVSIFGTLETTNGERTINGYAVKTTP